jgi:hypothetical protein
MGALSLSFTSDSFPLPQMSVLGDAMPAQGTCCLVVVADLYQRGGAVVSVNVSNREVNVDELGEVITLDHAPVRLPKFVTPETDKELVAQLLRKVQLTAPEAKMKWNEEEYCWYIKAPRAKKSTLMLPRLGELSTLNWNDN